MRKERAESALAKHGEADEEREAYIEATRRCLPSMIRLISTDLPLACARNAQFNVINDPIIV